MQERVRPEKEVRFLLHRILTLKARNEALVGCFTLMSLSGSGMMDAICIAQCRLCREADRSKCLVAEAGLNPDRLHNKGTSSAISELRSLQGQVLSLVYQQEIVINVWHV